VENLGFQETLTEVFLLSAETKTYVVCTLLEDETVYLKACPAPASELALFTPARSKQTAGADCLLLSLTENREQGCSRTEKGVLVTL